MSFFNPLLLLLLAPFGGLIVVMYILKLRRKDVVVSSTYLWRQVIRDVQANAPFQKLRRNLLMLLQLIAVALAVFALARPLWRCTRLGGRSVAIVVDTSASMLATDVGRSRIDEAKRQARSIVDNMKPQDVMMVLSAGARPLAVTGFTADRSELARAIDSLQAHETTTNMRDAVNLAQQYVDLRYSPDALMKRLGEIVCHDNFTEMHAFKHHQAIVEEFANTREPWRWMHLVSGVQAAAISFGKNMEVYEAALDLMHAA